MTTPPRLRSFRSVTRPTLMQAALPLLTAGVILTGCRHPPPPSAHHGHPAHAGHAQGHANHRFENAEQWAKVFDDPKRDAWQKPDEVLKALSLQPTDKVADLGAGTGYFAVRLARAVPEGRVYAADVEPGMVEHLRSRAQEEKLTNLVPVRSSPTDAKLPEPVDLVLVVDTYHHIENRSDYFRKLSDTLRPGGRLVIIDFKKTSPLGPPSHHKLAPDEVERELGAAGYELQQTTGILEHQYFLTFARTSR